ncbi:threonine synthase [Candidatus Levibacter sp. Uisw_134_01]|uniref:threonine synthase n=1 Tax=Candidatus Levibacter sp. Uisw_134_01 TaxID=3230999 RepID=UPI003D52155E
MLNQIKYLSTRGGESSLSYEDVLLSGLARDGGLFMPEEWPRFSLSDLNDMKGLSYAELACKIMSPFMSPCLTEDEVLKMSEDTYSNFNNDDVASLHKFEDNLHILELFHGPTLAFKDYAMQFLSRAFNKALQNKNKRGVILGATSGDTGSAALEAFKGKENIDIFILFPHGRVSEVQQKQMTWINEKGAYALSVKTDFDGCQEIVKDCFEDLTFKDQYSLSAINSINWVRLLPQIVYYFYSGLKVGAPDQEIAFSVPTGNFGNILAGWMAKKIGLPVSKLICGSNQNDILTRFFNNGIMERKNVVPSFSPSMDIQVSSNFERLLFEICDRDPLRVKEQMDTFKKTGSFQISQNEMSKVSNLFSAYMVSNDETLDIIKKAYTNYNYILDPHSAVGYGAAQKALNDKIINHDMPLVSLACAHPAKFPDIISKANNILPELPPHLKFMMSSEEKFQIIDPSVLDVQHFIKSNVRLI